jgi:hypothetical protein
MKRKTIRRVLGAVVPAMLLSMPMLLGAGPAYANTVNGTLTLAPASGGSATEFQISVPTGAACSGDTENDGYHFWSYLVPQGTDIASLTFTQANGASAGQVLVEPDGQAYTGPFATAPTTGEIPTISQEFEWLPLVTDSGYLPSLTGSNGLLYTGSGTTASGIWEAGIACTNSSGALTDNWNTEVTFTASSTDTGGFVWSAVGGPPSGPPASTPEAPWPVALPVAAVVVLGGGIWFSRRRSARKALVASGAVET